MAPDTYCMCSQTSFQRHPWFPTFLGRYHGINFVTNTISVYESISVSTRHVITKGHIMNSIIVKRSDFTYPKHLVKVLQLVYCVFVNHPCSSYVCCRNATIAFEHISVPDNMMHWPTFHNGVAAGLRITPQLSKVGGSTNLCSVTSLSFPVLHVCSRWTPPGSCRT